MNRWAKYIKSELEQAAAYEATVTVLACRELNAQQPLLRLPAELRLEIYDLVTGTPGEQWKDLEAGRANDVEYGLMNTCHQIREELMPHYYSKNSFIFGAVDVDYDLYYGTGSVPSFIIGMPKTIIQNLTDCRIKIMMSIGGGPDHETHLAEVDLILEKDKYAIQGELDACRTEECLDEMTDFVQDFGSKLAETFEMKRGEKPTMRIGGAYFERQFEYQYDHMVRFEIDGELESEWEQDDSDLLP